MSLLGVAVALTNLTISLSLTQPTDDKSYLILLTRRENYDISKKGKNQLQDI